MEKNLKEQDSLGYFGCDLSNNFCHFRNNTNKACEGMSEVCLTPTVTVEAK